MTREYVFDCMEGFIRRVVMPTVGLAGIIYEELQGDVSTPLLGVYLSMVGLGAVPWIRDLAGRRGNGSPRDGS